MKNIIKNIENWNTLSLEEKDKAQKNLLEKTIIKEKVFDYDSAKYFEENGYVILKDFITKDMADFMYDYVKLSAKRLLHLVNNEISHDGEVYGTFTDMQAPGDYSKYGDMLFDTLLAKGINSVQYATCIDVIPTYTYHRLYTTNTELKRHKDRPSCEISTTLFLGHDISNVKEKDYSWPMFVSSKKENKELPVHLNPGDMIVYRGCEIEHWRERFIGTNHAQVFLHYNDIHGQYNIKYDGRPELGLPAKFKQQEQSQNSVPDYFDYEKKVDLSKMDYVI